ncbi:hemolysin family protein [Lacipirellula parvula]|uniref:CBS domain containing protein n=1 Tax=Lacipirellula parvula TaxID=2650471 RepID=A0A5K7XPI2_9BACT|nr:hemolysin family protein [Lacipirellula parvula]BBO35289.1 CBS domain containing protein [Lacipirellula parvula]
METTAELVTILVLVLLNGFFAGAEIAVLTARRNRLQQAAGQGSKGAKAAMYLLGDTNRFLSTVQVGITGVGTLAAAYGGVSLVNQLSEYLNTLPTQAIASNSRGISLAVVTGGIAFTSLILGELVPKRAALAYAERLATVVAPPMALLSIVARPFVAVLGFVTALVLRILRVDPQAESSVSVEDIEHLIESGREQGILQETEHEVALEALQLRNRRVRDIMRARIDIDAVDIETPTEEIVGVMAMSGFSRLPVYEDSLDHIIGFLYNKDVFQQFYLRKDVELRKLLRAPLFVPESLSLDRLLVSLREKHTQLAIVLDEFGGTRGMVTLEDVLEELVGEIYDETQRVEADMIVARDGGGWLVDGQLPMHDLMEHLPSGVNLSTDSFDFSTVSGLVLAVLERLPTVGEIVPCGDISIEVVDMDGNRIDRLLITLTKAAAPNDASPT